MIRFLEGGFDPFSFDSMTPDERLKYFMRAGPKFSEEGLTFVQKNFSDDVRPHVAALSLSNEYKLPTVLLDSGDYVQIIYDPKTLRIAKFRAKPTARNAALVVQAVMSALLEESGGDPSVIDPAQIKFGETERFARTYRGEWENAYKRYLATKSLSANPFADNAPAAPADALRASESRADAPQRNPVQNFNAASIAIALVLASLLGGTAGAETTTGHAEGAYTGPAYGPGTAIPNKPDMGPTATPGTPPMGAGVTFRFTNYSRNTISQFLYNYWLCPACGYTGGAYALYQPGEILPPNVYQPFPPQLAAQLPAPPPGTQYVFANRNALLISQANGQILDVIPLPVP